MLIIVPDCWLAVKGKPASTAVLNKQKSIGLPVQVALAVVGLPVSSPGAILVYDNGDYLGAGDHWHLTFQTQVRSSIESVV